LLIASFSGSTFLLLSSTVLFDSVAAVLKKISRRLYGLLEMAGQTLAHFTLNSKT
jgi:hypothetical protein